MTTLKLSGYFAAAAAITFSGTQQLNSLADNEYTDLSDEIDNSTNKYAYVQRARNLLWALLCQGILNDPKLEEQAEGFGRRLSLEAQYTDWLSGLATTRCRFILSDLVADKAYASKAAEGNFGFMRTNAAYKRSMEIAYKRWRWVEKRLNR